MKAVEPQPSIATLEKLSQLAEKYPGNTPAIKLANLMIAYNENRTSKQETEELNKEVGRDREVVVAVKYKGMKREVHLIPLSVLALLLALPSLWRPLISLGRRRREKLPKEPKPKGLKVRPEKPFPPQVPDAIRLTKLPPATPEEDKKLRGDALLEDIFPFFGHEKTRKQGVKYTELVDLAVKKLKGKETDEDQLESELAWEILKQWEERDKKINPNVSYQDDPYQIKQARIHAQIFINMARRKRKEPKKPYEYILQDIAKEYWDRKADRKSAQFDAEIKSKGRPGSVE